MSRRGLSPSRRMRPRCYARHAGRHPRAAARELLLADSGADPRGRASRRLVAARGSARVDALLDAGVRQFIDLTEEGGSGAHTLATLHERAERAASAPPTDASRSGISACRRAALMRATLDAIYAALAAGEPVYVHCWAGIGRTGTVVGCLLREQGFTADEALAVIARKWRLDGEARPASEVSRVAGAVRVHRTVASDTGARAAMTERTRVRERTSASLCPRAPENRRHARKHCKIHALKRHVHRRSGNSLHFPDRRPA